MDIYILDREFKDNDIIDEYESLIWTDRYNKCGDFEIYTSVSQTILDKLPVDYCLEINDSEHTMIIEKRTIKTDVEDGDKIVITGKSLEYILERRVIWGQKVIDGSLQNGVETLINENIINPVDPDRRIDNFIFVPSTDPKVTDLTLKAQYTGNNLYTTITEICEEHDIGFKIILNDGNLEFSLYAGADRSDAQLDNPRVVFSPKFDNLLTSDYIESKENLKTISLVGGEGEGSERKMETAIGPGGAKTGLERRETFTDARDVSQTVEGALIPEVEYLSQLEQRGKEELATKVEVKSFEGQVEHTKLYKFGVEYFMGDIIQIVNQYGLESRSRVTELIRSDSTEGYDVYPTFTKINE